MILLYLFLALLLLVLNAFFVLAEFAAVKMRPSRVAEMLAAGIPGAAGIQRVQKHLDEYLSVCQLGITFASIGLGFVAEPAVVKLIEPVIAWSGVFDGRSTSAWLTSHGIAFAISYLLVSFLHILIGELVPKSISIRLTDAASLWTAGPLRFFHVIFYLPLMMLNASSNGVLRLIGIPPITHDSDHSEEELLILLNKGQSEGMMSFRRLLFLENIFDLGDLRVKDAMRPRSQVQTLSSTATWQETLQLIRRYRFSRYPLVQDNPEEPIGVIHLKDALLADQDNLDLNSIRRPFINCEADSSLEALLAEMQRRRIHVALVRDAAGSWTGFLTLEDIIEEIIGTIRDEFEDEEQISMADALTEARIQLNVEAETTVQAVQVALDRMSPDALPVAKEVILRAIEDRERLVETYLGNGLGMPHARIAAIPKPIILVIRTVGGVVYRNSKDKADLLMVLLTPAGQPRVHQRLQAIVATVMDQSDLIPQRLRIAESATEVLEILIAGEQATLD
jgi:CBS domain containing-hemolysin-like protein